MRWIGDGGAENVRGQNAPHESDGMKTKVGPS